jgi:hypothetical protein
LTTPPILENSSWGCQNHPDANIATSFEGLLGVVDITGQMILLSLLLLLENRLNFMLVFVNASCRLSNVKEEADVVVV